MSSLLQVLFDWASHALTCYYNKKAELPQEVMEGLWTYLDNILHSKRLQHVLSQGKTISIRQPLAQVSGCFIIYNAFIQSDFQESAYKKCILNVS